MKQTIRIAVGQGGDLWHEKFKSALATKVAQGYPLSYEVINLDRHDWRQLVIPFDIVIWKPAYMGPRTASHLKEKIYFLERYMGKIVVPNFNTIWHFESKVAQSYLIGQYNIASPATIVSFDYNDSIECLKSESMPLVFKLSHGAASQNVKLVRSKEEATRVIEQVFFQQLWDASKAKYHSRLQQLVTVMFKSWFWTKVRRKLLNDERVGVVYWQKFIPENSADLRITAIGDRYAFGFWRNNRPNDFRASGSGRIDYERAVPEAALKYCIDLNHRFGFDSMAYDLLFREGNFVITEISYAYLDTAIYKTQGYYELNPAGNLIYQRGQIWPQQLWVEWALSRIENREKSSTTAT